MAQIALTLAPVLTLALTITGGMSLVTLANPLPANGGHTLTLVPASPTVLTAVAPILRGPKGDSGDVGPRGPQGQSAATTTPYVQQVPGHVWTCPHNLNRYPGVTVVDTLGQVITPDIYYIDSNIVRITHGSAIAGTVYFN